MENRDPNNLNPHVQVVWEDIIGEPEDFRTPVKCWQCYQFCYSKTRDWCYLMLAVLCGPFIAFCNGCLFGCLAFEEVWCTGPWSRCIKIRFVAIGRLWETCLHAICKPLAEVCEMFCSKIQLRYQRVPKEDPEKSTV